MLLSKRNVPALPLLLLIAALSQVSLGDQPIIIPNAVHLIKNEGEPLEFRCEGLSPIYFFYPRNVSDSTKIITSEAFTDQEEDTSTPIPTYRFRFRRPQTVYGDTGWYGCADFDIPRVLSVDDYYSHNISWVYVYIQSETSLTAQQNVPIAFVHVYTGEPVILPCTPTSPDYNVTILYDGSEAEFTEDITYDKRIGLIFRDPVVSYSGHYTCTVEAGDRSNMLSYSLEVMGTKHLNRPNISEDSIRHVVRGQTLRVNCSVEQSYGTRYTLDWIVRKDDRIQKKVHYNFTSQRHGTTVELIITNVTDADEGTYECRATGPLDVYEATSAYIKVYDPALKFINLTSQNQDTHYESYEHEDVRWVVHVDAYPEAILKWFDPHGKEIFNTSKHIIKYVRYKMISLTILDLQVKDMGVYTLEAVNENGIETINFTLTVMMKPLTFFSSEPQPFYYPPGYFLSMTCQVSAVPHPNITWNFVACPNYPSLKNSTSHEPAMVIKPDGLATFITKATMIVHLSGYLTCSACNELACDSATHIVLVSDVPNGFGILPPNDVIIKGDNVSIICGASIYNYTDTFEWFEFRGLSLNPIHASERITFARNRTLFTHRSIMKINNITMADSKNYTCRGSLIEGGIQEVDYQLIVQEPALPVLETNFNNTEKVVDMGEKVQSLTLRCIAIGIPTPSITWYKNGVLIERNQQYTLDQRNETLLIQFFREYDGGKYACRAKSRVGIAEAHQVIRVQGSKLPVGYIILIIILGLLIIILLTFFTIKVRREKMLRKELMEAGLMHFEEGALECLNPDLTVDDQAELLPYDKKWEFPRERLKLGKQLGSGAFGVVMKAEAQGICEEETVTTVAVKMVRRTTDPTYVRALASELKIMVHLGKHLNVVNLLGACTKNISKRELLVIVEYCRFGNLHNYLLRHRADFINQIDPATGKFDPSIGAEILTRTVSVSSSNRLKYAALSFSRSISVNSANESVHYCPGSPTGVDSQGVVMSPDGCVLSNNSSQPGWRSNYRGDYKDQNLKPICTQDLLSWAFQVARGMEYLSQRRVLHGDLAARNILLAENNIVKICDFGLAKSMYKDDNYKKKGDGPLPIKWMAIESIRDRVFSTQSDIWSFGIVLWEFFTLAETPYPGMEAEKQYQKLIEGYRMEQPEYATKDVYDIMLQCWKAKPTLRPSFTDLVESIGDLLEESVRMHYVSLNAPYMDMNTMLLESGKNDYLTMMSAPDHTSLSSPTHDYVNNPVSPNASESAYLCMSPSVPKDESGIFSPRPGSEKTHFEFPSPVSDSEDAIELSPMLKKEEDPYLQPINVHERRAEFARQRQAMKNQTNEAPPTDRDSGYCNTPRNLHLIDLNNDEKKENEEPKKKDYTPTIIRTQDNYVNMPKQKSDLRKDVPDGFSNPSYVMMSN